MFGRLWYKLGSVNTVILMSAYCHREVKQETNNSLYSADDLRERQLLWNFSIRVALRSSESERLSDNSADWKQHCHLSPEELAKGSRGAESKRSKVISAVTTSSLSVITTFESKLTYFFTAADRKCQIQFRCFLLPDGTKLSSESRCYIEEMSVFSVGFCV